MIPYQNHDIFIYLFILNTIALGDISLSISQSQSDWKENNEIIMKNPLCLWHGSKKRCTFLQSGSPL